jgi:Alpha/beta hydrolase of unknown function (DUF900)
MIDVLLAILRGLVAMWIIGLGMSGEALLALTGQALTTIDPMLIGIPGFIFVFPASVCGIIGDPQTWYQLLMSIGLFFVVDGTNPHFLVGELLHKLFDVVRIIVPLPPWLRESETFYPPLQYQVDALRKEEIFTDNECWIFINGVATPLSIADENRKNLFSIFHRPIYLMHNPTDGVGLDLLECIGGKIGGLCEACWAANPQKTLEQALVPFINKKEYKRVVLIAHSQGTIITGNALSNLANTKGHDFLAKMKTKLEVYAFANCSQRMPADKVLHLENLSNRRDTVAWLGALFPFKKLWKDAKGDAIEIGDKLITEPTRWGHFLNTHYLGPLHHEGAYSCSRLRNYIGGKGRLVS